MKALLLVLLSATAPEFPLRLPSSGGEVILPTSGAKVAHDKSRYAAARRVGSTLYVSGVIVTRRACESNDEAAFRLQLRRAFDRLAATLTAAGASFADIAKINTFHVWAGPDFAGDGDEQFRITSETLGEYLTAPYPAWTAVGTTGTLGSGGILEIELVAHVPEAKR